MCSDYPTQGDTDGSSMLDAAKAGVLSPVWAEVEPQAGRYPKARRP
ncbi:MAG TPA: hypothetical protein VFB72_19070 [Verrucomicrobiae bacterium]|nr:hypothetical protein [Verrucomicrobiae bacterium]